MLRVCPGRGLTRGPCRTLGICEPLLPPSGAEWRPMSALFHHILICIPVLTKVQRPPPENPFFVLALTMFLEHSTQK